MKSWQQRRSFWALLAAAALGSACGIMEQRARVVETPQLSKIQIARLTFVVLDGKTCNGDSDPVCPITVTTFVHGGKEYCVAVAPQVNLKRRTGSDQQKKVVWKLEGPELVNGELGGKPVAFHRESGIVIAYETASKHVEQGGLGDGVVGIVDPTRYHMKVNRNKPALTKSSYLPVVIWGSGGNEELCAAVDPLIFNEP
jgi:hypothetical protein